MHAFMEGLKGIGIAPGDLAITETFLDSRSLFLTPNTSTVYGTAEVNVANGPMVVVVPTGVLGPLTDGMFRYLTDVGFTGPDQGKRGRYLIVPADHKGSNPDGYFVVRMPSNRNLLFFRFFITGGDTQSALVRSFRSTSWSLDHAIGNQPALLEMFPPGD
jgi:hypothetical protein